MSIVLGVNVLIAGCARQAQPAQPEPRSQEEAAFLAADARLARFEGQEFFGNTPDARMRAEAFAMMVKTFQHVLDEKTRTKDASFEQVQGETKVLTHCEMRDGRIAFLAHVPDLDRLSPSSRQGLLELAFSAAKVAMIDLDEHAFTVAIGLRGKAGYEVVSAGKIAEDNRTPQGTESLHAFFGGTAYKGPSFEEKRRAFEQSRQPDPSSPPMLPGEPRGRHPSVGVTDHAGRTGMAVAIGPKIWVTAQHLVPRGSSPFAIVDAEGRRRVVEVIGRRDCEAYAWEMAFLDKPYVPTTLARVAAPGSAAFLYGVDNGTPIATPTSLTVLGTDGRGPMMTELELGARDLGRPLFDAQDRFVGLACNVEPKDPPQLMAVGDVRAFLKQGIDERERAGF